MRRNLRAGSGHIFSHNLFNALLDLDLISPLISFHFIFLTAISLSLIFSEINAATATATAYIIYRLAPSAGTIPLHLSVSAPPTAHVQFPAQNARALAARARDAHGDPARARDGQVPGPALSLPRARPRGCHARPPLVRPRVQWRAEFRDRCVLASFLSCRFCSRGELIDV